MPFRAGFIDTPMTSIQDLESLDRTKMIKPQARIV